jgi:hypothetical protein
VKLHGTSVSLARKKGAHGPPEVVIVDSVRCICSILSHAPGKRAVIFGCVHAGTRHNRPRQIGEPLEQWLHEIHTGRLFETLSRDIAEIRKNLHLEDGGVLPACQDSGPGLILIMYVHVESISPQPNCLFDGAGETSQQVACLGLRSFTFKVVFTGLRLVAGPALGIIGAFNHAPILVYQPLFCR